MSNDKGKLVENVKPQKRHFSFGFEPHPAVFKTYSWPPGTKIRGHYCPVLGDHIWCKESNGGWPHARQVP